MYQKTNPSRLTLAGILLAGLGLRVAFAAVAPAQPPPTPPATLPELARAQQAKENVIDAQRGPGDGQEIGRQVRVPWPFLSSVTDNTQGALYNGQVLEIHLNGWRFGDQQGTITYRDADSSQGVSLTPEVVAADPTLDVVWTDTRVSLIVRPAITSLFRRGTSRRLFALARPDGAWTRSLPHDLTVERVPYKNEWQNHGVKINRATGTWDRRLNGQISPGAAVKKDGCIYLYYIGAEGDRDDGGPKNRSLGVAVSGHVNANGVCTGNRDGDGVEFNRPRHLFGVNTNANNEEEGVFSLGAWNDGGQIRIFYSRCVMENGLNDAVDCSIYTAVSDNGINFYNHNEALRRTCSGGKPWGCGSEMFPLTAIKGDDGTWYVSYRAKAKADQLGVAWSKNPDEFPVHQTALFSLEADPGDRRVLGEAEAVNMHNDTIFLLLIRTHIPNKSLDFAPGARMDVYAATPGHDYVDLPDELYDHFGSGPGYDYRDLINATVFFDESSKTWFMYDLRFVGDSRSCGNPDNRLCFDASGIGVRTFK